MGWKKLLLALVFHAASLNPLQRTTIPRTGNAPRTMAGFRNVGVGASASPALAPAPAPAPTTLPRPSDMTAATTTDHCHSSTCQARGVIMTATPTKQIAAPMRSSGRGASRRHPNLRRGNRQQRRRSMRRGCTRSWGQAGRLQRTRRHRTSARCVSFIPFMVPDLVSERMMRVRSATGAVDSGAPGGISYSGCPRSGNLSRRSPCNIITVILTAIRRSPSA